ncbi:precorrin-3B C(17)-methyltransferase [Listeria monocytogenes]|uniref:precorrin-3B C(17)-methyltransferase n=1 Tax=Listeria monocytogenes TaxID=1639 RepID=UPI0008758E17|nr:precorrin-3B C(17)-methyltransferase [Listeria monocytogenes]EAC3421518.1 precorrin-3B C(17)-methyltransferase [Listeria monocytogenes]EAC4591942.1 precorrin-3B C(17)-methyltransferase [Listeria monocytogenes]EAC7757129.1 precorrin-3B C(17)-methyltransferase [Listeria monocytogenes]EAC9888962.1 precorrin-3B C(17)-methyltransferase [Listeria monocytogenes]EAD5571901.1 precorrin-3B C(17)-methyltransferase [Listeria monocytogenes]
MIYVIGIGPGDKRLMTGEALQAIEDAEVIVGYVTYIKLIKELIKDKEVVKTGMRREIDRCQEAVDIALTGKKVAVVSSGDAGIYGMAGLVLELAEKSNPDIEVKVIPGITASIGAAAVLGAPIMHDFCHISLSDLMTPWEVIEKRLTHAAMADFVVCFYNPRSKGRANHLANAFQKMMEYKSGDTVVGIVKDVGRKEERKIITTMRDIDYELVDMTTMVIVGNKETYVKNGKMITPRGYTL